MVRTQNGYLMNRKERSIIMMSEWNSMDSKVQKWFIKGVQAGGMEREIWVYESADLVNNEDKAHVVSDGNGVYLFFSNMTEEPQYDDHFYEGFLDADI